jgi:hypothetical protein
MSKPRSAPKRPKATRAPKRAPKRAPTTADDHTPALPLVRELRAIRAGFETDEARQTLDLALAVVRHSGGSVAATIVREVRALVREGHRLNADLPGRKARLDARAQALDAREAEVAALARELRDLIVRERALADRSAKLRTLTPVAQQIADDEADAIAGLTAAFGLDDEGDEIDDAAKPRKRTSSR